MVEAILRQYGVRTGFFSSPHLLSANERIRINGDPLDKDKFTKHFWPVYNRLMAHRTHEADMPGFFAFMTILGFHVFVAEQVDVLVLEVGIGGELDSTNIVRNIRTAGITSLALEHTALLGDTLTKIAWQKAGIIKEQSHVYTHVTQPECLKVIHERAAERHAHVVEVLSTEEYFRQNQCLDLLDSCNDYVRLNGSLAVQLAYDWLRQTTGPHHRDIAVNDPKLSEEAKRGLINVHWPGRCQLVDYQNMRVHLDGAHTVESIRVCCDWFIKSTRSRYLLEFCLSLSLAHSLSLFLAARRIPRSCCSIAPATQTHVPCWRCCSIAATSTWSALCPIWLVPIMWIPISRHCITLPTHS